METVITLMPLPRADVEWVYHLQLPPEQLRFGGRIEEVTAEDEPDCDYHCAVAGEDIVGFFKLDRAYHLRVPTAPLAECGYEKGDLGLRMVIVGQQYQGKGYGKALMAALPNYILTVYNAKRAFLTVNFENPRARHVYLANGWTDTGLIYKDGGAGPQHILKLEIS